MRWIRVAIYVFIGIGMYCIVSIPEVQAYDMLEDIDWTQLDAAVKESGLPYDTFQEYLEEVLKGEEAFSLQHIFEYMGRTLAAELHDSIRLIMQLFLLVLLSVGIKTFQGGSTAQYAIMLVFVWTTVQCFEIPYSLLQTLLQRIQIIGQAEIPVLAAIAVASGHFTTASLQGEILLAVFNILLKITQILLIPGIQVLFIVYAIEALTGEGWAGSFAGILNKILGKGMKTLTTILLILVSLRIQVTGISDQWMRRAARTMVSSVPVVGNSLSGAMDTVTSAAAVLLKTVGILGIILILLICLIPVCKLLILWLLYSGVDMLGKNMLSGSSKKLLHGLSQCISLMVGQTVCLILAYTGLVVVFVMTLNSG